MKKDTSWNQSAEWYNELIEEAGSYQKEVILPNLKRLMAIKQGQKILDLGCGTGFFSRVFAKEGAEVTGVDNSQDMIVTAKSQGEKIEYICASADALQKVKNKSFDTVTIILALQNMEHLTAVVKECQRVLKPNGSVYVVINHPTFRVPKNSSWEWTDDKSIQFRRVDRYLSESKNKIDMHPGIAAKVENYTLSFHRPLQTYVKIFGKSGFAITRLEEWISHRRGPKGKTFNALEQSRKEIPLFLFFEAKLCF